LALLALSILKDIHVVIGNGNIQGIAGLSMDTVAALLFGLLPNNSMIMDLLLTFQVLGT